MWVNADIPMEINIKDPGNAPTHSLFAIICRSTSIDPTAFFNHGHY